MNDHKSFRSSDFSLRDIPGFIVAYLIISAFSVGLGLLLEALPDFWKGFLVGLGVALNIALIAAYFMLRPRRAQRND